jgi:hypothetical protein
MFCNSLGTHDSSPPPFKGYYYEKLATFHLLHIDTPEIKIYEWNEQNYGRFMVSKLGCAKSAVAHLC